MVVKYLFKKYSIFIIFMKYNGDKKEMFVLKLGFVRMNVIHYISKGIEKRKSSYEKRSVCKRKIQPRKIHVYKEIDKDNESFKR